MVLIDTLHEEIKQSVICLADITTRNPNVMYELGYALASRKDVVLISSTLNPEPFPFDIRHRKIIQYSPDSVDDFEMLRQNIAQSVKVLLEKQETSEAVAASTPLTRTNGLQTHEMAALAFVATDEISHGVSGSYIYQQMEKAGFSSLGTKVALIRLKTLGLITSQVEEEFRGQPYVMFYLTNEGENWLVENQDSFSLHLAPKPKRSSDQNDDRPTTDKAPF